MTRTERLLRDLIALPSVNPAFAPPGDPFTGEQQVADFLAALAGQAGLEIEFQEVAPGRSNLIARLLTSATPRQRILLAPHLDTVNAGPERFIPRRSNGRIYGRGACDTKGSVAAMFTALSALARGGRRPRETEIVLAGLVDEENGQTGSRALVDSGFRADLAIVGEATRLQVVTAHKGSLWLALETRGKSAHGARPELGVNAVSEMARVVVFLEGKYAARLGRCSHPLLGNPTVSVGTIRGGTQPNVVPDRCTITIDRRTLPGETEQTVAREIKALLRQAGLKARLVKGKAAACLPLETDISRPLVARLLNSVGQRRPAGVRYFCDASVLAHGGIPSVVFGPGDIAQAHTADEWISVASLERAGAMLEQFLRELP